VNDFSIDLETLGNKPYSIVVTIGVAAFDRRTGEIDEGTHLVINASDAASKGLRMTADTVLWWMQQSDAARASLVPSGGWSIDSGLSLFEKYLQQHSFSKSSKVWGNGSGFDVNLLEDVYELSGRACPWQFWQARDLRTVVDLAEINKKEFPREGTHHNALDDAKYQALLAIEGIRRLKGAACPL
jgi:hypothetical protein